MPNQSNGRLAIFLARVLYAERAIQARSETRRPELRPPELCAKRHCSNRRLSESEAGHVHPGILQYLSELTKANGMSMFQLITRIA
jgi:hypothetical protein